VTIEEEIDMVASEVKEEAIAEDEEALNDMAGEVTVKLVTPSGRKRNECYAKSISNKFEL
jgi:hypothetical protein